MSHSINGCFLDLTSLDNQDLDFTEFHQLPVNWTLYDETRPDQVSERLKNQHIVISNKVVLNADTLKQADNLAFVQIAATGMNNIDLQAAEALGIQVKNITDYGTPSVVQHVFSLILALTTHVYDYQQRIHQGEWHKSPHFCFFDEPIRELAGLKMGIVGYGTLGKAVAKMAEAFGMEVLIAEGTNPNEKGRIPLTELLKNVDILSLHCPLTEENRHFIGANELALMKSDAILINTARGGLVEEDALAKALKNKEIAGAGFDVLETEPATESPLLDAHLPNFILTPHIAWASQNARQRLLNKITRNITRHIAGNP